MTTSNARCGITRERAASLAALCALLLAGCGSSGSSLSSGNSTAASASVSTPTRSDPATEQTTSSTTTDTAPAGAPSFVVHGTTKEGDKVKIEGRFGSPLRPSQSDVDQTALGECPPPTPDGRALVARLDLTTTLESSLAAEVELEVTYIAGSVVNFVMGFREGARCQSGQPGSTTVNFGSMQPGQSVNFTMWVVLPDAITPADPHPSEHALAAHPWIMGVPEPAINGTGTGIGTNPNTVSGPRFVMCHNGDNVTEPGNEYIAVVGDTPTTMLVSACPAA